MDQITLTDVSMVSLEIQCTICQHAIYVRANSRMLSSWEYMENVEGVLVVSFIQSSLKPFTFNTTVLDCPII